MHTEKREDPLVELGYEVRDLNTKAIRAAAIGFFIFAIGSTVLGFWIYRVMNPTVFEPKVERHRLLPDPGYPLIQGNITAKTDIMDIRQHEDAVLNAPAGWTDTTKTKLHIPIDRAMEIIAERGGPKTNANMPAVSPGHTPNPAIGEKPAPAGQPAFGGFKVNLSSTNVQGSATKPVPAPATGTVAKSAGAIKKSN